MMRFTMFVISLLVLVPDVALAGRRTFSGNNPPVTINDSNTTITNTGTIGGDPTKTGLTVNGTNNTVINSGNINGQTGVSMTGGSSSITNTGTISGTSTGSSTSSATGIRQSN